MSAGGRRNEDHKVEGDSMWQEDKVVNDSTSWVRKAYLGKVKAAIDCKFCVRII